MSGGKVVKTQLRQGESGRRKKGTDGSNKKKDYTKRQFNGKSESSMENIFF